MKQQHTPYHSTQKGFALLYSVLMIAAVGAVVGVALLSLGLGSSQTAGAMERSNQAKQLANSCAELAIQKLVTSAIYVGTTNTTLGQGSCIYTVTSVNASTSLVTVTGTVGTVVRRVQLSMQLVPLTVLSWQEIR